MNKRFPLRTFCAPVLAVALASCSDLVVPSAAPETPRLSSTTGATLLECPKETADSAGALIGPLGGTLQLNGHEVTIPLNAVLLPTQFRLVEPASNYMEVQVRAGDQEHFQFQRPVSLRISYARCTRSNIEKASLRIYHTDETTKAILADMGGTDDKTARVVTTSTDHLSGYTIGTPSKEEADSTGG